MAKRFFNTNRIEEDWYINLSCKHRELLRYCESKCDGAGVFSWNAKIASSYIGENITDIDLNYIPVQKLSNGKYFITGFCQFQNGELSRKSPAHNPIFKSIEENEIPESVLFCRVSHRVYDTLQEREKEKEKEIRNIDKYKSNFENDYVTDEKVSRENGFDEKQLAKAKFEFWNTKELDAEMLGKTYQDVQKHFLNWCRKNKDRIKKLEQGIQQPLPPSRKTRLT